MDEMQSPSDAALHLDLDLTDQDLHGDTLRAVTTVVTKRESQSRKDSGIVTFEHRALNQRNEEVAFCRRAALMLKKPIK